MRHCPVLPSAGVLHTASVQLLSSVWRIGLPVVVVASSGLVLVAALGSREKPAPMSRAAGVLAVLVWLRFAGEAALGDQRPLLERQWKGAAAVLFAVAAAIHLWRRRSWRGPAPSQPASVVPAAPADRQTPVASATHKVTMPALGTGVIEATVTRWLKPVGGRIEAGEPLVEVSTDKVDIEVPADTSGHLGEIRIPAGMTAPVGSTLAMIEPAAAVAP